MVKGNLFLLFDQLSIETVIQSLLVVLHVVKNLADWIFHTLKLDHKLHEKI